MAIDTLNLKILLERMAVLKCRLPAYLGVLLYQLCNGTQNMSDTELLNLFQPSDWQLTTKSAGDGIPQANAHLRRSTVPRLRKHTHVSTLCHRAC